MSWWRSMVDVDDERGMARLRRLIGLVLVCGLVACAGRGGSGPADPVLLEPGVTTGAPPPVTQDLDGVEDAIPPPDPAQVPVTALPSGSAGRVALAGFGEVAVELVGPDGTAQQFCLLLAELPAQLQRGLMEVLDPGLGGYDGMLFRFAEDHGPSGFYMRNTPSELSIAYFDAAGGLVSIGLMAPCGDVDGCPTYTADGLYRLVLEVPTAAGGVQDLGVVPGSTLRDLGTTCTV